jgi:hypothetical protein
MKSWHIHVYNVNSMYEVDITANSEEEAQAIALNGTVDKRWVKSDRNTLAVVFQIK